MVSLARVLLAAPKGLSTRTKFLDKLRVFVKGGPGGEGYPKYGGMGGSGGDVVFVAGKKGNLYDFVNEYPKKRFLGGKGENSQRYMLLGSNGEKTEISLPPGVVLSEDNGTVLGELNKPGDKCIVAKGGAGGGPMNKFRAAQGEARSVVIDLKLLADIGLVGFPNAGKSTFLKAVSNANPKIANYPFTTLRPQLGTVIYEDGRRITIADLPGLIEGAHMNIGMGHYFLKHLERTKLLLVVVDLQGFVLNSDSPYRSAFETTILLNKELEMYKPALLDKPHILLLNKMDKENAESLYNQTTEMLHDIRKHMHIIPEELRPNRHFEFKQILSMSAEHGDNIEKVKELLRNTIDEEHDEMNRDVRTEKLSRHIEISNAESAGIKLT